MHSSSFLGWCTIQMQLSTKRKKKLWIFKISVYSDQEKIDCWAKHLYPHGSDLGLTERGGCFNLLSKKSAAPNREKTFVVFCSRWGSDPSEYLHSKVCALCGLHPLCGGDLGLSNVLVSHLCQRAALASQTDHGSSELESWGKELLCLTRAQAESDSVIISDKLHESPWGSFSFSFFFWVGWFWVFFGYFSSCSLLNILVIRS